MKIDKFLLSGLLFFIAVNCPAQKKDNDRFLENLLQSKPEYFSSLLAKPDEYNIRIIYTRIDRKKNGKPKFTNYYFNQKPGQYFYPASTVKFPVALMALEKLNKLKIDGLNKNTGMITEEAYSGQTAVYNDPTTQYGSPTVAHYIKKIFLVSDNDAFNRLYEFVGQEQINRGLRKKGYKDAEIVHRLSIPLSEDENRHTNPVRFFVPKDSLAEFVYEQPLQASKFEYPQRNDKRGNFDFSRKNRIGLEDLHSMMRSVFFPESIKRKQRFKLTNDDYAFVREQMSMFPSESKFPFYDTAEYWDKNVKLILWGGERGTATGDVRIFNKSGQAYGFLTDVTYVVDFRNNIEFMLSAVIHCNSDGIYNDDRYDYQTIGFPFMKNLGETIYQLELKRERKNQPDLSSLKFQYGK